jgi:hypothetical protein
MTPGTPGIGALLGAILDPQTDQTIRNEVDSSVDPKQVFLEAAASFLRNMDSMPEQKRSTELATLAAQRRALKILRIGIVTAPDGTSQIEMDPFDLLFESGGEN